jgi:hypothetical protein
MRLCMFHPVDHPMERGWVGRVDGDHVVHLAAQTLQSFFTGGGAAREHAVYPLGAVRLRAPVLHPPSVRVFEDETTFAFANPAAVVGPDDAIASPAGPLRLLPRLAAVVGAGAEIGGLTGAVEWRAPSARPPKDRDFAFGLGPLVVTGDEVPAGSLELVVRIDGEEPLRAQLEPFDWHGARDLAAAGTRLYPGDLLVGPPATTVDAVDDAVAVELDFDGIGSLRQHVARE